MGSSRHTSIYLLGLHLSIYRQQHARIRLQWQDMGSSVVWLRNAEMKRLLLSISKVGMVLMLIAIAV